MATTNYLNSKRHNGPLSIDHANHVWKLPVANCVSSPVTSTSMSSASIHLHTKIGTAQHSYDGGQNWAGLRCGRIGGEGPFSGLVKRVDGSSISDNTDRYPVGTKSTHKKEMQSERNLDKSVPNKHRSRQHSSVVTTFRPRQLSTHARFGNDVQVATSHHHIVMYSHTHANL